DSQALALNIANGVGSRTAAFYSSNAQGGQIVYAPDFVAGPMSAISNARPKSRPSHIHPNSAVRACDPVS
ncbi:MAG: hypothetical protein V7686_05220, partial [Qipengyuania sp.]